MSALAGNTELVWQRVGAAHTIPRQGARVVKIGEVNVAIFKNVSDEIFALEDRCPHKGGPLSQGIVHGRRVTCPLHNWVIELHDGNAVAPDIGCVKTFSTKVVNGDLYIALSK
ncbi:MAG: nitrite reductase small subunit NirD [Pseudomonadota bacterium]